MSNKLLEIFKEEISEQGREQARQYSLPMMMYLSVIAILMGAKNPIEIHQWMKNNGKRKEIKKLLGRLLAKLIFQQPQIHGQN